MEKNGRIMIAQRSSRDRLAGMWEFPGGKLEDSEAPADCLKRELMEEFDIDVTIGPYLGSSIYHYDHISIELMAFRAYWEGGQIHANNHADFKWIGIGELGDYAFTPADMSFVDKLRRGDIAL